MQKFKQKIIASIRRDLRKNIDNNYKKGAFIFFKEKVKIIGVRTLIVKKIARKYFQEIKNFEKKEIFNLCEELLKTGKNEEITIAFNWAFRLRKQYEKSNFSVFERWLKKYVSNWASCDDFCTHTFGYFIFRFQEFLVKTEKWSKSKNRWLRRASAVILIYPVRQEKYLNNIFKIADILLLDQDNLVQKGYGWMLKEASNVYPNKVFKYVMKNKKQMPRIALRYAIEKLPKNLKQKAMRKSTSMNKLIVILGPTGSGKTEMAIKIAKKVNGEIVSADSRQIYKEMNIGTAKPTQKEMAGIPHHLISLISPKKIFTVTQYRKLVLNAINKIFKKGKIPILCGGTGFYIQAIIDGLIIPKVEPDWKLRNKLGKKSTEKLFEQLKKLDPERAKTIERKNKRRLIRAIEIITKTKKPIQLTAKKPLPYPILILGIKRTKQELEKKISKRVEKMITPLDSCRANLTGLKNGLEKEVKGLVEKYGWIPAFQTIGYQEWKGYFERNVSKDEVKNLIILHTKQFAKRQMTWFKRDKKIIWIKNYREVKKIIKKFILLL